MTEKKSPLTLRGIAHRPILRRHQDVRYGLSLNS